MLLLLLVLPLALQVGAVLWTFCPPSTTYGPATGTAGALRHPSVMLLVLLVLPEATRLPAVVACKMW